jgi:acetyl esterase
MLAKQLIVALAAPLLNLSSTVTTGGASMPQLTTEMNEVLNTLASLGGKPIETLEPSEARKQPTPADAIKALMAVKGITAQSAVTTKETSYPTGGGSQKARLYTPAGKTGASPIILYIYGGGWVIADIDVYDATPRALADATGSIVASIEYRQAPEASFPPLMTTRTQPTNGCSTTPSNGAVFRPVSPWSAKVPVVTWP